MLIRKARQEDLPQLLEIYNHEITHGVATFDLEPLTLKERQDWFDAHQDERHPLLVADENGTPVGYTSLSPFLPKAAYGTSVELSVYVDRSCRGRGVGLALTQAVLDLARADPGTHRVYSLVTAGNEASRRMHKSWGFALPAPSPRPA